MCYWVSICEIPLDAKIRWFHMIRRRIVLTYYKYNRGISVKKLMAIVVAMSFLAACNQSSQEKVAQAEPVQAEKATVVKVKAEADASPEMTTDLQKASYAIGSMQGARMRMDIERMQEIKLDKGLLEKGFIDGINDKSSMSQEEVQEQLMAYQKKLQEVMAKKQEEEAKVAKASGDAFLKENAGRKGVTATKSGLQYEMISKGDGKNFPKAVDTVKVHYVGTLTDGSTFDSSVERGQPAEFPLNGVIPGWTEGLQLMSKGAKFKFYLPPDLGYGARALPKIPANSVLVFEVELLEITPAK